MKDNKMDIAIIDGNIHSIYDNEIYKRKILSNTFNDNNIHATICYLIIKKYSKYFRCSNVCLLGSNYGKDIINLYDALDWCLKNNIFLVNLSFGTTHFKDFSEIQKTVNYFTNKGMLLICATSNDNLTTYPASLSSVIGVKTDYCKSLSPANDIYLGIDFIAPSVHKVDVFGDYISTSYSNSYATPYVTAQVLNQIVKKDLPFNIKEIKKSLLGNLYNEPFNADWISNALIIGDCGKSKANYYFNYTEDLSKTEDVDTIIICENSSINSDIRTKNLVCLLEDSKFLNQDILLNDKFCWTPLCKKNQITSVKPCNEEILTPVVNIVVDKEFDKFYMLKKLIEYFAEENYNTYVICEDTKSVLYNLEYIPNEFLMYPNEFINTFICQQIKYRQIDLLLICTYQEINNILSDLLISLHYCKEKFIVSFKNQGNTLDEIVLENDEDLNYQIVYDKLISFLS